MLWWSRAATLLRVLFRKQQVEAELDAELKAYRADVDGSLRAAWVVD